MVTYTLVGRVASTVEKAIRGKRVTRVSVARAADISGRRLRARLAGKKPFSVAELDRISDYLGIDNPLGGQQ